MVKKLHWTKKLRATGLDPTAAFPIFFFLSRDTVPDTGSMFQFLQKPRLNKEIDD